MTAPFYDVSELPDGQPPPQDDPARVRDYNRLVRNVAKQNPRTVTLVGLNHIVSPGGRFTATIGRITVRAPDGIHFPYNLPFENVPDSLTQANNFAHWLDPKLFPTIVKAARGLVPNT
jgi:hypothetical protein